MVYFKTIYLAFMFSCLQIATPSFFLCFVSSSNSSPAFCRGIYVADLSNILFNRLPKISSYEKRRELIFYVAAVYNQREKNLLRDSYWDIFLRSEIIDAYSQNPYFACNPASSVVAGRPFRHDPYSGLTLVNQGSLSLFRNQGVESLSRSASS